MKRSMQGVTLMELMIVLVVISILATVAVPSYRNYLLRAHRADATAGLLRIRIAQEKFYLQNNAYTTQFGPTGLNLQSTAGTTLTSPNGYYQFAITIPDPTAGAAAVSFRATATAVGKQNDDAGCTSFTINDQGTRTTSPSTVANCWR